MHLSRYITRSRRLAPFLLAAALLLAGCEMLPQQAAPVPTLVFVPPPTPTLSSESVYTVARGPIREVVTARGRVASGQEVMLAFRTNGYLKAVNVQAGDFVQAGALLAELDATGEQLEPLQDAIVDAQFEVQLKAQELEQAKSEPIEQDILNAKSALKLAEVSVQQAQAAYDKVGWQSDSAAAQSEGYGLQRAQLTLEAAQASYNAAVARRDPEGLRLKYLQTQLAYNQAKLERANRSLERAADEARLAAPFDGTVVSMDKRVGDKVDPYETIGVLADPAQVRLEANILESDIDHVRFGLPVSITLDAYPDRTLSGKIQGIAVQPIIWQGKNAYAATVEFDDPTQVPATIRMGADVSIVTRVVPDALLAPVAAIKDDGTRRYVELMKGGAPSRVDVGVGVTSGSVTQVLWGLSEGDQIKRN